MLKSTVFWDVTVRSLVEVQCHFGRTLVDLHGDGITSQKVVLFTVTSVRTPYTPRLLNNIKTSSVSQYSRV
jgi:hypothetical protein